MRFHESMMRKGSLIDDVEMSEMDYYGFPILFQNPDIRKMFLLAKAGPKDVFYDLGSGWAQNIIIALKEFHVKKAIGIEKNENRIKISRNRLTKWKILEEKGRIVKGNFNNPLKNKLKDANIREATIVFYGLSTDKELLEDLKKNLKPGCRLLYYYNCLFPEIMPDDSDFPFYVSKVPFTETSSEIDWLKSVTKKRKSSIDNISEPTREELWDELRHDYDIQGDSSDIRRFQSRIKKVLRK